MRKSPQQRWENNSGIKIREEKIGAANRYTAFPSSNNLSLFLLLLACINKNTDLTLTIILPTINNKLFIIKSTNSSNSLDSEFTYLYVHRCKKLLKLEKNNLNHKICYALCVMRYALCAMCMCCYALCVICYVII